HGDDHAAWLQRKQQRLAGPVEDVLDVYVPVTAEGLPGVPVDRPRQPGRPDDMRALPGEGNGDGAAETSAGAGDQSRRSGKFSRWHADSFTAYELNLGRCWLGFGGRAGHRDG